MVEKNNLERVQKIIGESGYCSRRKAEELIEQGKVTVNGKIITLGDKADATKDSIKVEGKLMEKKKKVYFMINKPRGFITTNDDMYDRKKVTDLIQTKARIFPVGRLDRDASGLLLLTNDGEWANNIIHPSKGVDKEYMVRLDGSVDKKTLDAMNQKIFLDDGSVTAVVKLISKDYLSIVIHAGRNKIVKRFFNHFNLRVIQLKRVRIGNYVLGKLKEGEYKSIKPFEHNK